MSELDAEELPVAFESPPAAAVADAQEGGGALLTLDAFARTLAPRVQQVPNPAKPGTTRTLATPGQPEEVFLTLLRIEHGRARHTAAGWHAVIDALKQRPAHPMHPQVGV